MRIVLAQALAEYGGMSGATTSTSITVQQLQDRLQNIPAEQYLTWGGGALLALIIVWKIF